MTNVVGLHGDVSLAVREPHAGLVETLESLLAEAQAGEIQSIAYAAQHADGCCSNGAVGKWSGYGMLGAIESVKTDIALIHMEYTE